MPPQRVPSNSSEPSSEPLFDRTYLKPLFVLFGCPSCGVRYRMDCKDLEESSPDFKCSSCESHIRLKTPIKNSRNVQVELLELGVAVPPAKKLLVNSQRDVRKCPKCSSLQSKGSDECGKCGVIFSRLDGLPLEQQLGAIPSLVKAWQELMSDYSNLRKHFEFVDRCEDLRAIPFALKKYEELKSVQPQDEIAQSMLQKVIMRRFSAVSPDQYPWVRVVMNWQWTRIFRLAPLALGLALIVIGLAFPSLRNLVGLGVATGFVTIGFVVFSTGRFDLRDFL